MEDVKSEPINENKSDEYGLNDEVKVQIVEALENDAKYDVNRIFSELHSSDQAAFVSAISTELREKLISIMTYDIDPQFLTYLENDIKNEVIEFLGARASARAIGKLEIDDAVEIIEDLEDEGISDILELISKEKRIEIEEALSYPESSVGRIMHQNFVAVKKSWTVGQATRYLQEKSNLPDEFHHIIIVDNHFSPISEVLVSTIIKSRKNTKIDKIMTDKEDVKKLAVDMDQEEAARLFSKYSLTYAPVIDEDKKLVGVIYAADVIDILEEEAEEDILLLGGVNESNLYSSAFLTATSRIPWLFTSLMTAAMAVIIIAIFSDQIQRAVVLAVLLPIVASLAGNAGTQALTILVRSIATDEISNIGAFKVLVKEVLVGSFNGLILSIVAATICYFWQYNLYLSVVLAISILFTVIFSGFFGAAIPLLLNKMKFDPALSSGVFLYTITDAISFFIFLGLSSIFI